MKKTLAWISTIAILSSSMSFAAPKTEKTESVFINLGYYGGVDEINVYNTCNLYGENEIRDFGKYESITNLTNKTEIKYGENGEIIWDVDGIDAFSYIGKIDNLYYSKIPWTFDVTYKLNGVPTKAEDLLHKSGTIELNIDINPNKEADEYYKNNYMLEVTGNYDMNDYLSVESDEAMFVEKGNTKTLMFIALPGQKTNFTLRIGSNDFKMSGLTFAMMALEGEMLEKVSDAIKSKNDIEDALDAINESTDIVLYAMKGMSSGMNEVKIGIEKIDDGADELHKLNPETNDAINNLIGTTKELQENIKTSKIDLDNTKNMINNVFEMIESVNPHVEKMSEITRKIEEDMDDISEIIEDLPDDLDDIKDMLETLEELTSDLAKLLTAQNSANSIDVNGLKNSLQEIGMATATIQSELSSIAAGMTAAEAQALLPAFSKLSTIGSELSNVQTILGEVETTLSGATTSQQAMINRLKRLSNQIDNINDMIDPDDGEVIINSVDNMDALTSEFRKTLKTVSEQTDKILENKENVLTSIDNLKDSTDNIDSMLNSLNSLLEVSSKLINILDSKIYEGSNKTMDGVISITNQMLTIIDQADAFINSKNKAKNALDNQIDKVDGKTNLFKMNASEKPVSFVSTENTAPEKVQFLLKLPDIVEIDNSPTDLETESENGTFLSRILYILEKMFGWIIKLFIIKQ